MEVTRFALDKRLTYRKAEELGIAAPWTSSGRAPQDLQRQPLPFPLILKPGINHHFFPHTNVKALPADNLSELVRRYAQMNQYIPAEEILIQERIPGGGECQYSFCGLCQEGKVIASLVARRLRQYPVDFGNASTFVETAVAPEVDAAGRNFLEAIGFDGMAEVEFKFDVRDNKYKILDVNARPWGWHTLGAAAGINFSYLLWRQKTGLEVPLIGRYRSAARCREITDLFSIAKGGNAKSDVKKLFTAVRKSTVTVATFSLKDPVPFFAELGFLLTSGLSRQKRAKKVLKFEPADSGRPA